MPDWEIQPKKHKYEVGERVLVRPAIIDGIWAKTVAVRPYLLLLSLSIRTTGSL